MIDEDRPFRSTSLTQLRVLSPEAKADRTQLEELQRELRKRHTPGAKKLLKEINLLLAELGPPQLDLPDSERTPLPDVSHDSNDCDSEEIEAPRQLTAKELATRKRIAELRMRLLDLSNTNRLLNYKFDGRSRNRIRLVDELPDQIVDKLQNGKRLLFRALPEPGDEPGDEKSDSFLLALEQTRGSDEEYLTALEKLGEDEEGDGLRRVERALRDRLRKMLGMPDRRLREQIGRLDWARQNDIDPSFDLPSASKQLKQAHFDGDLQTLLFGEEMERTLSAVHDQTRSALQETGVNTLYLALGYLEWYEASQARTAMYAPLLLHPIDVERKIVGGKYRYSIGSLGEETEINITLSERLHQDFHRRLPSYSEGDTPDSYFQKAVETIEDLPGWRLRRFAVVGHFAFARLAMFHDLDDSCWPGGIGIIDTPIIAKLFAGSGTPEGSLFAEEYEVDNPAIAARVPLLITDADSSQISAIVDVMDGKDLAIKGPPGTGKSQTITNIVAAALANQKTVLFVAEKMAALNVVKDRLERFGLGHFCLELHSTKARKKDLLESLKSRLDLRIPAHPNADLPASITELERTRGLLSDYVATINRAFGAYGKTVHQILWCEQRTRSARDALPKAIDNVELPHAIEMTRPGLESLRSKLQIVADVYPEASAYGRLDQNPWFGITDATLDYFGRESLVFAMQSLSAALQQFSDALEVANEKLNASIPCTIRRVVDLREALGRVPEPVSDAHLDDLYVALYEPANIGALDAFHKSQGAWLKASSRLAELSPDPRGLVNRSTELAPAASLARELGLDHKSLRDLADEASALRAQAKLIEQAIEFSAQLSRLLVTDGLTTPAALWKMINGVKHAAGLSLDLAALRHPGLFDDSAALHLREAQERAEILKRKMALVNERLALNLEGDAHEWRYHAEVLRSARLPALLWQRDVRAAKSHHRGLCRVSKSTSRREMASDFEAAAECVELAASFTSNPFLQAACGAHFRGYQTDFGSLLEVNAFGIRVKRSFNDNDAIDAIVRRRLLEDSVDLLAQLSSISHDPQIAFIEGALADIADGDCILETHRDVLLARAEKIAELERLALAAGLKPDLPVHTVHEAEIVANDRRQAEAEIDSNNTARLLLGPRWRGAESDRELISDALRAALAIEQADLPPPIRRYLYHAERNGRIAELRLFEAQLSDAIAKIADSRDRANSAGKINEVQFFGSALDNVPAADARKKVDIALGSLDQLVAWTAWLVADQECRQSGLGGILDAFTGRPLEAAQLSDALERSFWRTLARLALADFPPLSRFRGLQLQKAREQYRRLDEDIIRLQREALAAELGGRPISRGDAGDYRKDDTGLVLVQHELHKQKRHIPVRALLDRAGLSIQQMKPCFMMSPLSVAQFLKPTGVRFDLVVIDEASQMRPEEALGAIARGGQLVVVGDPMQLPPTSFFDRADRISDDELDAEEIVDNESILDLALSEFRPARSLRWHYRSRHESLIAFSNRQFYDDLIVFPSPLDTDRGKRQPKLGVYHHFVPGRYKGRVNIEEAQQVAEAAILFMMEEPDRSLGIVTLNQTQRDILLEEIERLIARDPAAQRFIESWENSLEPFFVKNLESVQGDERDVIFISTVYGPDAASGLVRNQFGPINGKYGHRRLNVLFTRAKHRVEIFTSMRSDDIRPDERSNRGVHVLKAYLEYAETGRLDVGSVSSREPDSDFEILVKVRLQELGFEVVPQVGVAGYFIDLAVKHPKRSGFVLGIECDGASYHSSRSARDRDRLRQQILEALQWNIYRIWSTDWFQNPDVELRRLVEHLEHLTSMDYDVGMS